MTTRETRPHQMPRTTGRSTVCTAQISKPVYNRVKTTTNEHEYERLCGPEVSLFFCLLIVRAYESVGDRQGKHIPDFPSDFFFFFSCARTLYTSSMRCRCRYKNPATTSMGSSLKLLLVAEGKAHICEWRGMDIPQLLHSERKNVRVKNFPNTNIQTTLVLLDSKFRHKTPAIEQGKKVLLQSGTLGWSSL